MFRNQKIATTDSEKVPGTFSCSRCDLALFDAGKKFDVGSGFPSFWDHIGENVKLQPLSTYGRNRVQLLCQTCGQHLGHLFHDARTPTLVRYCMNAASLQFHEKS